MDPDILVVDVPLGTIVDLTPPAEGTGTEDPAPVVEEDIERLAPGGPSELRAHRPTHGSRRSPSTRQRCRPSTAPGTGQDASFDLMMAALFGALASLAIGLLTLSALAAGRRRN